MAPPRQVRAARRPRSLRRRRELVVAAPPRADWGRRYGAARGLFRVFGAAVYRFYRRLAAAGPPVEGDAPFATSATLPATPGTSFADGTWLLSVSYFNGVADSGFLAIGPNGETYVELVVSSGGAGDVPPRATLSVALEQHAGGVVRVVALYAETGAYRATTWAIAYTTNGSAPPSGSPTTTQAFTSTVAPQVLVLDLPAQVDGTTVKVLVQVRRSSVYSDAGEVLSATADASGPSALLAGDSWAGQLPDGTT